MTITDGGSHFKKEFDQLCQIMNIIHKVGTPGHPQMTGQDENTNGLILGRLRRWTKKGFHNWDEKLADCVLAINTRKVDATGFTPMQALIRYTARAPLEIKYRGCQVKEALKKLKELEEDRGEQLQTRLTLLEAIRGEVTLKRRVMNEKIKKKYDKKVKDDAFEVGDYVLMKDYALEKQWSRKLDPRWTDPYKIIWKGEYRAYGIEIGGGKEKTISRDHLKRYFQCT